MKLGSFMSQGCNYGKEINKVAWCACKWVVLSIKTYEFFAFSFHRCCCWFCYHPEIVLPWWRDVTLLLSMDSTNNCKCTTNFPSTWLANRQWLFKQDNHGVYLNPGTQVGDPVQGLGRSFADGLNKNFHSICDTGNLNPYL